MRGAANVADLARADQVIERPQGFFLRMRQRRAVKLVQVNVIRLQALERVFTGFDDVIACATAIIRLVTNAPEHLGCQDNLVAQVVLFQKPAGDLLAFPCVVYVRGIEEIDPRIHSFLHDRKRFGFIRRPAKIHRA